MQPALVVDAWSSARQVLRTGLNGTHVRMVTDLLHNRFVKSTGVTEEASRDVICVLETNQGINIDISRAT